MFMRGEQTDGYKERTLDNKANLHLQIVHNNRKTGVKYKSRQIRIVE